MLQAPGEAQEMAMSSHYLGDTYSAATVRRIEATQEFTIVMFKSLAAVTSCTMA